MTLISCSSNWMQAHINKICQVTMMMTSFFAVVYFRAVTNDSYFAGWNNEPMLSNDVLYALANDLRAVPGISTRQRHANGNPRRFGCLKHHFISLCHRLSADIAPAGPDTDFNISSMQLIGRGRGQVPCFAWDYQKEPARAEWCRAYAQAGQCQHMHPDKQTPCQSLSLWGLQLSE